MKKGRGSRERGIYTVRLAASERALMEAAAAGREEHLSEFIRRVGIDAARRELREEDS